MLDSLPTSASLTVCGLGFYELFVNGERMTRGRLAPYITNPDQLLAYDTYDLSGVLRQGKNTLGFILGSGMQNAHCKHWGLSEVPFASAPKLAFALVMKNGDTETVIEADENVRTKDSEILFNDLRYGETVDRRLETVGWSLPEYDDSGWDAAIPVSTHIGEPMERTSDPLVETYRRPPVRIFKEDDSYIYDFGLNGSGLCELKVSGMAGQRIEMLYGEIFENGKFSQSNLYSNPPYEGDPPRQRAVYVLRGDETETYLPTFTYFGFRYVKVSGITEEQATPELLRAVGVNRRR